jgi:hypothetical protein
MSKRNIQKEVHTHPAVGKKLGLAGFLKNSADSQPRPATLNAYIKVYRHQEFMEVKHGI